MNINTDNSGCDGWIDTYTNKKFYLLNPTVDSIDIIDIAHALSMICRFGGHSKIFYSVAQHSLMVESLVPPEIKLEALLHDATEAYYGDMVRPLKVAMPAYRAIENNLHEVIAKKFGLRYDGVSEVHEIIKKADNIALVTEKRDLKDDSPFWSGLKDVEPVKEVIVPLTSNKAKKAFFKRFNELYNEREKKNRSQ